MLTRSPQCLPDASGIARPLLACAASSAQLIALQLVIPEGTPHAEARVFVVEKSGGALSSLARLLPFGRVPHAAGAPLHLMEVTSDEAECVHAGWESVVRTRP